MTFIDDLNPDRFVAAGDWHGNFNQANRVIGYMTGAFPDVKTIVQLGDFGLWHGQKGTEFLDKLNAALVEHEIFVLWTDGNHENFVELEEYPLHDDGYRIIRSNIIHLPRGFRWEWYSVKFGALGGAHSVDKHMRTEGSSWWPQEWVTRDEINTFIDGGPVDVVVMHDSPAGAPNNVTDDALNQQQAAQWFGWDNLEMAALHRKRLALAIDPTDPFLILHGHYHRFWQQDYVREGGRRCTVVCLDEGGGMLNKHTMLIDVLDLQTWGDEK